jgi:hypothetical protein
VEGLTVDLKMKIVFLPICMEDIIGDYRVHSNEAIGTRPKKLYSKDMIGF